jgi:hypothetical protein
VVDWRLVVQTGLLQDVVEHAGASRGRSGAPSSWVDSEGLVLVVIAPRHARLAMRLLAFLVPLVLLLGLLGLAALRGRVVHALALLPSKMAPTASSPEAKLVAMSNSSLESTGGLRTRSRRVVPSRKACTISDWATLGSSVQRLEKRRMKSRSDSPGFWVHARRSQEFPGCTTSPGSSP